jgi:hypothetical protein
MIAFPCITVVQGCAGHFAALVDWVPHEQGGYADFVETGFGRYATREEAVREAHAWAQSAEVQLESSLESLCSPECST